MKKIFLTIFLLLNTISCFAISEDTKFIVEQMDKRFESMQQNMDKRFEQVDKRFEQIDKRFESTQQSMDKRFEQVDKKLDNQFYLIIAAFTLIFGYLLKERKYISSEVEELITPKIENKIVERIKTKTDKSFTQKIVTALEELAQKDEETRDLLKRHHLELT